MEESLLLMLGEPGRVKVNDLLWIEILPPRWFIANPNWTVKVENKDGLEKPTMPTNGST
jgi:hypothetical protein